MLREWLGFTLNQSNVNSMTESARLCVLVVDDWSDVGTAVADFLSHLGYTPRVVSTGAAAAELVQRGSDTFALALIDVHMSHMDGPATLDAIRALVPSLPCVFMCAGSSKYTVDDLLSRGGLAVLRKPLSLQELGEVVAKAIGRSRTD